MVARMEMDYKTFQDEVFQIVKFRSKIVEILPDAVAIRNSRFRKFLLSFS